MYCPPQVNTKTFRRFSSNNESIKRATEREKKTHDKRNYEHEEKKSIKQQAQNIRRKRQRTKKHTHTPTLFQLIYKRNFLIRCAKQRNPIYGWFIFFFFFFLRFNSKHWTMFNLPLNSIFLRLLYFLSLGVVVFFFLYIFGWLVNQFWIHLR